MKSLQLIMYWSTWLLVVVLTPGTAAAASPDVERCVHQIVQDGAGAMWFWTGPAIRYDGRTFATFIDQDGMFRNGVSTMLADRDGAMWFGNREGVTRYDGQTMTTYSSRDGLVIGEVRVIFQDRDGYLWFGSDGYGVSRYDGRTFVTFTTDGDRTRIGKTHGTGGWNTRICLRATTSSRSRRSIGIWSTRWSRRPWR